MKYEEVYLYVYDGVSEAKIRSGRYVMSYNQRSPHIALDDKNPGRVLLRERICTAKNSLGITAVSYELSLVGDTVD